MRDFSRSGAIRVTQPSVKALHVVVLVVVVVVVVVVVSPVLL